MSMRPQTGAMRDRRESMEDPMIAEDNLSDDDNAQPDVEEPEIDHEDPLVLAFDDLEGRVVAAIDEVKRHPGTTTDFSPDVAGIHEELAILLRPVLEVAAHTGPSVARTYYKGTGPDGIEASVEDAYEKTVSDLVLPFMLEMAQSDGVPAKRVASLEFFRTLYKECHKAGSWLDCTTVGLQVGPYGPGAGGSHHSTVGSTPANKLITKRRHQKRLNREGEMLRYWIEAAVACLTGSLDEDGKGGSRAVIAASAAMRPSLRHISQRIRDADDRGAARLYSPVMKMVEAVLRQLTSSQSGELVRSACVKFLEIVILCCSPKPPQQGDTNKRKGPVMISEDFSLDDLPTGHPSITRESLESIAEYSFATLRGMTMMGGQVKIDHTEMNRQNATPTESVVSILKSAALAYLEIESSVPKQDDSLEFEPFQSTFDYEFKLSQKSYALTVNAMSALAMNRPTFFLESALCLARRAVHPPIYVEGGVLTKGAILVVSSQLRASCLTLLRNATSITSGASDVLHRALVTLDMELQADKAFKMANQANELKTASRAARNQAKMFYEWDASENDRRSNKRQKETDDALAKLRAAKRQRGLGGGIQLPVSMSDAVDLVLLNLSNLPKAREPTSQSSGKSSVDYVSLEDIVDAILTNGGSLQREEGRWYDRNGGTAWSIDLTANCVYQLGSQTVETLESISEGKVQSGMDDENGKMRDNLFLEQCSVAASNAVGRILASASTTRSKSLGKLASQLASRLAFTLKGVKPVEGSEASSAAQSITTVYSNISSNAEAEQLKEFVDSYPLVASSLFHQGRSEENAVDFSVGNEILNEAFVRAGTDESDRARNYDMSLDLFVTSAVYASQLAKEKPNDSERRKVASQSVSNLQKYFVRLPRLSEQSLLLLSKGMLDFDDKKVSKSVHDNTNSATTHAAKVAAEKRATAVLLILRDVIFQRDTDDIRKCAVGCAVAIAAGRFPASAAIHDKATKLVMNVLFVKNELIADSVSDSVCTELEIAAESAAAQYDAIQAANREASDDSVSRNPLAPRSDTEKQVLEKMKKPAVLMMALCVRRPDKIQTLFRLSCQPKADILSKAVRSHMGRLSKAAAAKHGVVSIAMQVAELSGPNETPMLLAFLENLVPSTDKTPQSEELVEACFKIQESKLDSSGKRDPRYLIPVVSAMKRKDLVDRLAEFVAADDNVFLAALVRMGERVGRLALLFREEADPQNPSLLGMTFCEQLVFLHRLDFGASGLPQNRYLAAIKLCLENPDIFSDRVLMSAIDEMSGRFISGEKQLPLAFMRSTIIVATKHESLHSWVCHVLLPRLVEGKIWNEPRQWEGWMRCAHMLEKSGDPNVSSVEAISKLPEEQLIQYRSKWVEPNK